MTGRDIMKKKSVDFDAKEKERDGENLLKGIKSST